MHRSLVSMQDLPIISEQGLRLGALQDAYFDPLEQRIIAFVIDWENNLVLGPENILPIYQITELNADIVTVPSELGVAAGLEYDVQIETDGLLLAADQLIGKTVVLKSGQILGELVDMQIDPRDGSVAFYEIAPVQATLSDQPNFLLAPMPDFEFQEARMVVPDAVLEVLRRQIRQNVAELKEGEPRVTFIEDDEPVGEDDIEVTRSTTTQSY